MPIRTEAERAPLLRQVDAEYQEEMRTAREEAQSRTRCAAMIVDEAEHRTEIARIAEWYRLERTRIATKRAAAITAIFEPYQTYPVFMLGKHVDDEVHLTFVAAKDLVTAKAVVNGLDGWGADWPFGIELELPGVTAEKEGVIHRDYH